MRVPRTPPSSLTLLALALATLPHARADDGQGEATPEPPIHLEADRAEVRHGQAAYAEGNVVITRAGLTSESDWVKYNLVSGQLHAGDRVKLTQDGDTLSGTRLDLAVDAREGTLDNPEYAMAQGLARGSGRTLFFEGRDRYRIEEGSFTTCPAGNNDWYLRARELNLDYTTGIGDAWHGWFEFKGVPVAYYPWADFPLNDKRKTGFLPPVVGYSSGNGTVIGTPFYWNIAPNYDATFWPTWYSERGLMLGGEARYLWPSFQGVLRAEAISDRKTDDNRYSVLFQHQQQLTERLSLQLDLQRASDDNYFNDFGNSLEASSQTTLPRDGQLRYRGDGWNAGMRWQTFQVLQSEQNPVVPPYNLEPQFTFSAAPVLHGMLKTGIEAEATNFQKTDGVSGWRSWVQPSVSLPFANSYSFITPKLSFDYTQYRLDAFNGRDGQTIDRSLPMLSLDTGLFFEREGSYAGTSFVQTLEPRIYYLYVPYKDQSAIPLFDTSEADLTFNRLFMENRFTGHDRINDANDVTLALTSRLFDSEQGHELLNTTIGQRIYFTQPRVGLAGNTSGETTADALFSISSQLGQFRTAYDLQYNFQNAITQRANLKLSWSPEAGKVLNLRYLRNRTTDIEQVGASGQWNIGGGWYALGQYNYSLQDHSGLEALLGVEYKAGCWGLRLAAQRYPTSRGDYQTNYFFTLELSGLGGVGSSPVRLLQESIPDYYDAFRTDAPRPR
ncbi:LPS-assembly protein LptD [Chitinilyticum litopenaei]|uniref:LPS-assembly protein LptD n=1 Tax=Chitinilyticum litopenaei TaxID=1121276 RepID=UPI000423DA7A|nr:LPS-assembly protein LptD [Chitinilyticum litopenaei]